MADLDAMLEQLGKLGATPASPAPPEKPAGITREDLKRMTPEQIVAAKAEGKLDELLGIRR